MFNGLFVLSLMFTFFSHETVGPDGFYQKWDSNNWTTLIGSANTPTTIMPLPDGKHYLYTDFYRNNDNNGASAIYIPLDFEIGTQAGAITPFSLDFDFRFLSGSENATTFLGFFNLSGDNDGSPAFNCLGVQLSGSSVTGIKRSSAGSGSTSVVSGSGAQVLQRVKIDVYNRDSQTLMDILLYRIDEEIFHVTKVGEIAGAVLLSAGETFPMGLDVFGVRNTYYPEGSPASHAQMQIDNIYFSTTSENAEWPVPSFAELCVSSVLESTSPINSFDPWDTTRWAAWYTNGSVLAKSFAPDCDISFASGYESANPWEPDVSGLPDYQGEIFFFGNGSRGITFNGNGTYIDIRQIKPSLSSLYSGSYDDELRHPLHYGIYNTAGKSSALDGTTIKNLWIKGFKQGIHTGVYQTHPLLITGCNFRRNDWGVYLRGTDTTLYNNNVSEGAHGGLYLETGSYGNWILGNFWKDNNYQETIEYGDIVVDASYGNRIEDNAHLVPTYGTYHAAMKLYRNCGENNVLRENGAHANEIIGNSVDSYAVAYEVGSRVGMTLSYDLSGETRDYASYNLFESNSIANTAFGIKINTSGNEVSGNTFSNVTWPILLHNVMYSLTETYIHDQDGDRVSYWVRNTDFTTNSTYAEWFHNQDDRNQGIETSDRYTFFTYSGSPGFDNYSASARLIKRTGSDASQIIPGSDMKDVYKSAGIPIDVASGDFWEDNPGDEFAVIWSRPVSMVDGTNYYTIIIYDSNGMEVNRCGKSLTKWKAISAGDFLSERGDEIAAIPEAAVNGTYPIYVFSRGRERPSVTNLPSNTIEISALAGGNFNPSDSYDEIAYVFEDSLEMDYCKPESSWTKQTDLGVYIRDIAAGNFDGDAGNGDEVVAITRYLTARAYLYRVGGSSSYATVGPDNIASKFNAVASGDFDGDGVDEVAVALSPGINGEYPIRCYDSGSATHFKEISQNVLGVPAKAIGAFSFPVAESLSVYERVEGFADSDYGSVINGWGDSVLVLPSSAQTNAIPAFVVNADPQDDSREYLKVIPLVR